MERGSARAALNRELRVTHVVCSNYSWVQYPHSALIGNGARVGYNELQPVCSSTTLMQRLQQECDC